MCGADWIRGCNSCRTTGSPPRVRGRRFRRSRICPNCRFTPACAGQTLFEFLPFIVCRFTPACAGQTQHFPVAMFRHAGSPPRVRGRRSRKEFGNDGPRFTPACAGQTCLPLWKNNAFTVHPRVCGADAKRTVFFYPANGSPPRVRGRQARRPLYLRVGRFTPACAGQTCALRASRSAFAVHPRVCGADVGRSRLAPEMDGSPPRVRGRRFAAGRSGRPARFTPACAGQTAKAAGGTAGRTVHPRVCGADGGRNRGNDAVAGSPPRVRGRHRR